MNATIRRKIAMSRRALDFALAHPLTDKGYTTVVSRLQAEIARADTLGILQTTGKEREHAALAQRTTVRQVVRRQQLRRLCTVALLAAVDHPELAGKFIPPPSGGPNRTFLLKAKAMLADAIEQKDLLSTLGLGDTFIEELTQAVATYESATETAHGGRADHVGAGTGLEGLVDRCTTDVTILDTFIQVNFANDDVALGAWRSAKNLAGPFTAKSEAATPPEVTPPAVSLPAPGSTEPGK